MKTFLGNALERAFADGERIRFIQIGGNDGIHQDPLYQYHLDQTFDFEWGHVFEPIPEYFEALTANMRRFSYVKCHNLAVDDSAEPGHREFNYVPLSDIESHGLPPSSKGIGSFSRNRNSLGGIGYSETKFNSIKPFIRTIQVETVPASGIANQYSDANFLLTDCEGHDLEIIRAAFSQDCFRPKVVQFEDLRHSKDLRESTIRDLCALGYQVSGSGKDVICERI